MAADADIFNGETSLRSPLIGSCALHAGIIALALFGYLIPSGRGESWGGTEGGGGAMSATLVTSVPLPAQQAPTQNVLANESKGLSQSEPKEEPKAEEPEAIPIPEKDVKRKNQKRESIQKKEPPKQIAKAQPDNQVPYGQGGPVSGPYGSFSSGATKGGFGFQGGSGDFGSRFAYYVDVVRRKVSENWLNMK